MSTTPQVFISYSQEDRPFVERLAQDLKALQLGVWVDFWEIRIGDSLVERVEHGLKTADYVIAVLSQHSVKSRWVKKELNIALHRAISVDKRIILPIRIEQCDVPDALQDLVYADFTTYEKGFEALIAAIYPEGALAMEARDLVNKAKQIGYMLPECFLGNALSALSKRLVPMARTNYGVLFWAGMESWFEHNIESGITALSKWEQLEFFIEFAVDRFGDSEGTQYSIPWRFIGEAWRAKFDWDKLSLSERQVKATALFGVGPSRKDIRFAHAAIIDFAIACQICFELDIFRQDIAARVASEFKSKIAGAYRIYQQRSLSPFVIRTILDLSDIDKATLLGLLRKGSKIGAKNIIELLRWREANDLRGSDFSALTLSGVNFASSDLTGANFRGSLLEGCNFAGAVLTDADWRDVDIKDIHGILPEYYRSLCFSGDGKYLYAGTVDGIMRRFDLTSGFCAVLPASHRDAVYDLTWDRATSRVISASRDGTIKSTGVSGTLREIETLLDWQAVAWEAGTLWWVTPHDWCVGRDEVIADTVHYFRRKHSRSITTVALSRRLERLAFGTWGGVICVTSLVDESLEILNSSEPNNRGIGHPDTVWRVRFGNQAPILVSAGGFLPWVKVWDLYRRDEIARYKGEAQLMDVVLSEDDKQLFGANDKGRIVVWDIGHSEPVSVVDGHMGSAILAMDISYRNGLIATGDEAGCVKLWTSTNVKEVASFQVGTSKVWRLQFSPDGHRLACTTGEGTIRLLETDAGLVNWGSAVGTLRAVGRFDGMHLEGVKSTDPSLLATVIEQLVQGGARPPSSAGNTGSGWRR